LSWILDTLEAHVKSRSFGTSTGQLLALLGGVLLKCVEFEDLALVDEVGVVGEPVLEFAEGGRLLLSRVFVYSLVSL